MCSSVRDRDGNLIRTEIQADHPARRNTLRDVTRNGAGTATAIQHADPGPEVGKKKRAIGVEPAAHHERGGGLAVARSVSFHKAVNVVNA